MKKNQLPTMLRAIQLTLGKHDHKLPIRRFSWNGKLATALFVISFLFIGLGKTWALNPPPAACPDDFSVCINEDPFDLTPLSGFPGSFTGTGVVMNIFYPSVAGSGMHSILHTYMVGMSSFSCSFVITVDSTFACFDTSVMQWVFLPPGSTNGSCISNSNCCQDTLCYGLKYTPASTGVLNSYTTGFFTNCLGGMSPVVSNMSCVMDDKSFEINGCNPYNKVLFNSSGNTGLINVTANTPVILHKVCFLVPVGDTLHITEDTITDLTTSIKLTDTTFVTEHPSFDGFDVYRTGPVAPVNQASTIQCIADATEPTYPPVADMCGTFIVPSLDLVDSIPHPLTCEGSVIFHYTYTDCSGQSVPWTYTYTIDHTSLPHQSGGPVSMAATVACIALAVPPALPVIVDVCGDTLSPTGVPVQGGTYNGCEGTRTYTYSYVDCSGLPFTWIFSYLIERLDITMPPDGFLTVSCPADADVVPTAFLPVVTDNCGLTLSPSGPVVSPSVCVGTRTYTYTYTDCAMNTAEWVYTYTILPNTSLSIHCPDDLVLTCAANVNYVSLINAWIATATATDACDANPVITSNYDGMSIPSFSCMGGLPVTFTATDACGNTATCTAVVTKPCFNLESWVYLEGAAASPSGGNTYTLPMRTTLNDFRLLPGQLAVDPFLGNHYSPPGQPYTIAPWLYPGTEGSLFDSGNNPMFADAGYPSTVVDWVLVSLRTDSAGTGGPACEAAALLHKDGSIQFVQPLNCCNVNESNQYFVVIEHRNHMIVMSQDKQPFINHKLSYDFRFQQSYEDPLFAGLDLFLRQKEIISGKFAMYAGNGNQTPSLNADTDINSDDRSYWEGQNGQIGAYRIGDYNLNADTNSNDRIVWERNNGKFTSVPRN